MSLLLSVRYCYNTIYLSLEIRSLSFCLCFGAQQSLCEYAAVSICSGSLTSFNIELKHRNLLFIQTILITICYDHTQQKRKKSTHTYQTVKEKINCKQKNSHGAFQSNDMNNERKSYEPLSHSNLQTSPFLLLGEKNLTHLIFKKRILPF